MEPSTSYSANQQARATEHVIWATAPLVKRALEAPRRLSGCQTPKIALPTMLRGGRFPIECNELDSGASRRLCLSPGTFPTAKIESARLFVRELRRRFLGWCGENLDAKGKILFAMWAHNQSRDVVIL